MTNVIFYELCEKRCTFFLLDIDMHRVIHRLLSNIYIHLNMYIYIYIPLTYIMLLFKNMVYDIFK